MKNNSLSGGVAVITGAASGIGEALARYAVQQLNMKVVSAILPGPVKTKIFETVDEAVEPVVAEHLQQMIELLDQNGMSAQEAAETIFSQLQAGQFWVSTHPEITQAMAQQRADSLSNLSTPFIDIESVFNL